MWMGRAVKAGAIAGAALLVLAGLGVFVARLWYHDDACSIEQYQCTVGTIGFWALYVGPLGGLLLVLAAVGATVGRLRQK
jgi:hypothetical protein